MDLFDLGEGFSSLVEGVARIQCPTLVSNGPRTTVSSPVILIRTLLDFYCEIPKSLSGCCLARYRKVRLVVYVSV